jgi:hypothetical protein
MSEDIDKRVLRKYEIREKLGKGVRGSAFYLACCCAPRSFISTLVTTLNIICMA